MFRVFMCLAWFPYAEHMPPTSLLVLDFFEILYDGLITKDQTPLTHIGEDQV